MTKQIDDDVRFRVLRLLEQHPHKSQRELSDELGVSLGSVNYILRALVAKGEVKINNFRASDNKLRYAYILTPSGLVTKARLMKSFVQRKRAEFDALKAEIATLDAELAAQQDAQSNR